MLNIIPKTIFYIKSFSKSKALNLLRSSNISFYKAKINKDSRELEIIVNYFNKSKFEKIFNENKIEYTTYTKPTPVNFLIRNKHRIGFLIGCILLITFNMLSSKFIWKIEINGNSKTSNEAILESLDKVGLSLGAYIPNINYNDLHNKFLIEEKNISWISVNINGNVANVIVREKIEENKKEPFKHTNIIAKEDGLIKLINVISGKKQIIIGDVVKKGDLLISGVVNSQAEGVRYLNAKGKVYAYVNKDLTIKIPLKTTKKQSLGDPIIENSYTFFKNNIKIYNFNNKNNRLYDIIEEKEYIYLFDKIKLPIEKITKKYYPYRFSDIVYSNEMATDLAIQKLNEQIDIIARNAEIISKNIKTISTSDEIIINCSLYCIEDIAQPVEFYVNIK